MMYPPIHSESKVPRLLAIDGEEAEGGCRWAFSGP